MLAAARLWVTRAYFDLGVAIGKLDWDAQMVAALPAIRTAKTPVEYGSAVMQLIGSAPEPAAPAQRTWVHFDIEHSAFLVLNTEQLHQRVDMGGGMVVNLPLSANVNSIAIPVPVPEKEYASTPYPSTEVRILAAFKLWGAMHYFFAYRDLMDADWDDEFPKFLHQFIDAKDAREYHLAVAQAVTKLDDSNTAVSSPVLDEYFGIAGVPLRLRLIDKKPVVTEVLDDKSGVQVGDIVLRVDGEEIVARIDREASYLPASSHQALSELVADRLLNGAANSDAVLTVRHHDGAESDIKLKRSSVQLSDRSPTIIRQLSPKIGYIDLTRLPTGSVDHSFKGVLGLKSLILDARGPLQASARAIAANLNSKSDVAGAILTGPLVISPDLPTTEAVTTSNSFFRVENVPAKADNFEGQLIMLIDGRTIGEAERLGLYLEAARKVVFVGSDSAGACSTLSHFSLPGGIRVQFSSVDVRHGNTGKLQRLGLTPVVAASPELGDIRAGRDVVLEKAVEYLGTHE